MLYVCANIPNAVQMVKLPWISYAAPVKLHQEMQNKERKKGKGEVQIAFYFFSWCSSSFMYLTKDFL
jgi:hypothetical protein